MKNRDNNFLTNIIKEYSVINHFSKKSNLYAYAFLNASLQGCYALKYILKNDVFLFPKFGKENQKYFKGWG